MFKDTQFMITFQLALIGIVLIFGLFLIWKAITRVEEKIDMIVLQDEAAKGSCCPIKIFNSDSIMKQLFADENVDADGGEEVDFVINPTTCFSVPDGDDHYDENSVMIEDVSDAPTDDVTTLSKTKLRQMNLDKIKALCEEKGLSTDGTKNQLIEKLLS